MTTQYLILRPSIFTACIRLTVVLWIAFCDYTLLRQHEWLYRRFRFSMSPQCRIMDDCHEQVCTVEWILFVDWFTTQTPYDYECSKIVWPYHLYPYNQSFRFRLNLLCFVIPNCSSGASTNSFSPLILLTIRSTSCYFHLVNQFLTPGSRLLRT